MLMYAPCNKYLIQVSSPEIEHLKVTPLLVTLYRSEERPYAIAHTPFTHGCWSSCCLHMYT